MYRTGDRGVRRSDGQIEFRGRLDRQIKIRGQRVELDEIASLLAGHPGVEFATAVAKVSETGENQIVAYILPNKDSSAPSANELRNRLALDLPESMMPAVFVPLQELPLSANGKIDFSLLPSSSEWECPERLAAEASTSQTESASQTKPASETEPDSETEKELLGIVRKVLNNEQVTAKDNFFLVGGHSLLGMQLLIRLRDVFGVDLSMRELLEAPTAERLAACVKTNLESVHSPAVRDRSALIQKTLKGRRVLPPGILALQPKGSRTPIFCVHHLNWVHYLQTNLADALGEDQPLLFAILTAEDLAVLGPAPTLQNIATRLVRTLIAAQEEGPYNIAGFDTGAVLAFEVAQQLRALGREISLLELIDPANPAQRSSTGSASRVPGPLTFRYLKYTVTRGSRLGLRTTLSYLNQRLYKRFATTFGTKSAQTERTMAHEILNSAVAAYKPETYAGKISLLLPSTRRPQADLLAEWRALTPHNLQVQCVEGHHRDLLKPTSVQSVANAINSSLASKGSELNSSRCHSQTLISSNRKVSSQEQVPLTKSGSQTWWKRIPRFLPQWSSEPVTTKRS